MQLQVLVLAQTMSAASTEMQVHALAQKLSAKTCARLALAVQGDLGVRRDTRLEILKPYASLPPALHFRC